MTRQTLAALRRHFETGRLARDDFWRSAQARHRALTDYFALLRDGPVEEIRIRDGELLVELCGGLRMVWNPDDIRTAPNILLNHGEYEEAELTALLTVARRSEFVLDVGANVGWYTLHLARVVAPRGGCVYAFEPIPRTYAALARNVALNALGDAVSLSRVALGESPGQAEFFVPSQTGSVAASRRPLFAGQENETVRCPITTLDAFVREKSIPRVDLVKCDVEGGELFVLRGGRETIARDHPVLFLEMLRKWSRAFAYHPDDIIALLAELGYRCYALGGDGLTEHASITGDCAATNFLFLHDGAHAEVRAELAGRTVIPQERAERASVGI